MGHNERSPKRKTHSSECLQKKKKKKKKVCGQIRSIKTTQKKGKQIFKGKLNVLVNIMSNWFIISG